MTVNDEPNLAAADDVPVAAASGASGRTATAPGGSGSVSASTPRRGLWSWLYSVNLTLWLLGLLVLAMALGTLIPQAASVEVYERTFGVALGRLVARTSLTHVFSAWWFSLLFALLAVNLTACAVRRSWALTHQESAAGAALTPAQVRGRQSTAGWTLGLAPAAAYDRLTQALRGRGYRVMPVEAGGKEEMALRARRGGVRSWGPIVVHAGLVVVVLGAAYGRLPSRSFDRMAVIASGDTYQVDMGDKSFGIRLLDAGTERTASGAPSQYWAKTQVVQEGRVVSEFTITPNHPLRYRGTNVVLDSLSEAPKFAVEVRKGKWVAYVPIVTDASGQVDMMSSVTRLEDPPWLVWVRDFRPGTAGEQGGARGAAALVRFDESGAVTANRRELGWVGPGGLDYKGVYFDLVSTHGRKQAQLGIHRDAGVPIVWGGFGLIVVGCLLAFFVTRREIVATLAPRGGGRTSLLAGASAFGLGPGAGNMLDSLGAELAARQEVDDK